MIRVLTILLSLVLEICYTLETASIKLTYILDALVEANNIHL